MSDTEDGMRGGKKRGEDVRPPSNIERHSSLAADCMEDRGDRSRHPEATETPDDERDAEQLKEGREECQSLSVCWQRSELEDTCGIVPPYTAKLIILPSSAVNPPLTIPPPPSLPKFRTTDPS